MMAQLNAWLSSYRTWKLIYRCGKKSSAVSVAKSCQPNPTLSDHGYDRASVHGFTARSFHKHCDKKGPTVTVCKTEKGYSPSPSIVGHL
jgi:hypothetical protein